MVEDGHGYESGKPEEHGDRIEAQYGEWMVKLLVHYSRREGEVDDDEDGPNGAEELERILRGSVAEERSRDYALLVCAIGCPLCGKRTYCDRSGPGQQLRRGAGRRKCQGR